MTNYDKICRIREKYLEKGDIIKRNRIVCFLGSLLIVLSLCNKKVFVDDSKNYIGEEYNGNIYFCDSIGEAKSVTDICSIEDVVIVDQTYFDDPNIKIISSYKINDSKQMLQILKIIKNYCDSHSSNWDRSIDSMYNEWKIHNICYSLSINRERTDDVDLNNNDEMFYKSKLINKILGN